MKSKRSRLAIVGILALALSVTVGLGAGSAQAAKKKTKAGGTIDLTGTGGAIPDGTATTAGPPLTSTITVGGKKFKGTKIRDVNVTVQTAGTGATSASDLRAQVTAPNGATTWLWGYGALAGVSVGPLTLDDESANSLGGPPPAFDSTTLVSPYAGSAQPDCFSAQGGCTFSAMDNGGVPVAYTLRIYDSTLGDTNTLVNWRLTAIAGKAFRTK